MVGISMRQMGGLDTPKGKLRQIEGLKGNSAGKSLECEHFGIRGDDSIKKLQLSWQDPFQLPSS